MLRFVARRVVTFLVQIAIVIGVGYAAFNWLMESIVHARQEVVVPDLQGKTLQQAFDLISSLNLALSKESEEYAPNKAVGIVIKQYPVADVAVREGKIVRVVLSLGSEKIEVPELIGLSLRKAEIEIRAAGLALGEIDEVYSLKQAKSYVVSQEPKPMSLVEKGHLLNLAISLGEPGPDKILVPDFIGNDVSAAENWAKDNGVGFKALEEWEAKGATDGTILKQNLESDAVINRRAGELARTVLEVTVARNLAETQEASKGQYLEYVLPAKPQRQREIVFKVLVSGGERQIYQGKAWPGEKVRIPTSKIRREESSRVRIYLDGVFAEEITLP